VLACLVGVLSLAPAANMLSSHQVMNRSFEPLMLVNSYGAFGSVGRDRHELVIEGTDDDEVGPDTVWQEYELPCKPGNPARRPCLTDVYHRRLDWQIWFAAMYPPACEPWMFNLLHKLLEGDGAVRALFEVDPFPDHPPRWVRVQRFRYRLAPPGAPTWWQRSDEKQFLPPASLGDDDWLAAAWDYYRWRGCR
ncbi:MAG TPA: lipase maturation factor family protein, partial [Kofleriaceae bacterium]|nr:lipase maturation factor family protein [Kofleriaceae bacterium]